jgi:NADH-quinone oxidoreductase subunit C
MAPTRAGARGRRQVTELAVPPLEQIKILIEQAVPGAKVTWVPNETVPTQASLRLDLEQAFAVAQFLRDDPALAFDYASNVTGIDWPDRTVTEKVKGKQVIDGVEKEIEESRTTLVPGYLEAVYHLYSMARKHGPLIIRLRTEDRGARNHLPSLTPLWRGAELQEREIFDLYGIVFDGHPDLRRLLMWEGFEAHPMRKDYVEPDDYEWEPTPHDEVDAKAKAHAAKPERPA